MKNNEWIMEVFQAWGEKEFLIFNGQSYTYSDLVYKVESVREKLQESGLRPDDCVAVIGDYSPNVIFMLLALILNGNIIVPVAKETPAELIEIFSTARVSKVVKFDCQDRWDISIVNQSSSHPLLETLRNQHEAGVIIFTSGTSGKSKAAVLQVSRLIERYKNFKPKPFRTLIFLKLDHIGGINTLFSILFNGGALITATGRSPEPVCEAIQKYQVELLPTTPTFLNMLIMSQCYQNYDLSSLKLISYGTEPMPMATLEAANRIFPGVTFKQTYGLTELGIFSTKSKDSNSSWMKIGGAGVETKIVDGCLWIRTKSAMLGYLNAPSPFDTEGWYNTGDQVELDGEFIKVLGRKSEIINVGGEKVYPAEVENVLLEIPNIKDALVTGKKNPVTGNIVTATVVLKEPEDIKQLQKRIVEHCKSHLHPFMIPALVQISPHELVGDRFKKTRNIMSEVRT